MEQKLGCLLDSQNMKTSIRWENIVGYVAECILCQNVYKSKQDIKQTTQQPQYVSQTKHTYSLNLGLSPPIFNPCHRGFQLIQLEFNKQFIIIILYLMLFSIYTIHLHYIKYFIFSYFFFSLFQFPLFLYPRSKRPMNYKNKWQTMVEKKQHSFE